MNLSTHSHELTVTEQSDWIVHHLFLLIVAASNISVTLHRGQIHLENTRLWEPSRLRKYKIISPRHRANAGVVLTDTFGLLSLCSWHQTKSSEKLPDLSFLIPCTGKKEAFLCFVYKLTPICETRTDLETDTCQIQWDSCETEKVTQVSGRKAWCLQ